MGWIDEPAPKTPRDHALGSDLSTFSVEELNDYLAALAAERERVEAVLAQKKLSRQSAHSVFKT